MGIKERKEKKKTELKQEILDASVKLFSEHGYDGVSIRKIAEVIEYSPTTVYLYFKDKNEILYELHEIGFKKFAALNQNLRNISNPLLRLNKLGENYLKFGLENPEYYDLMYLIPEPMEFIDDMKDNKWAEGDKALDNLKTILQECMDKKLIKKSELNVLAMSICA
jgi:AcrR family transcriptional regulator